MAVAGIVVGLQGLGVEDDSKWSDDELKSAVEQATYELDGHLYRVDESGDPIVSFHTYDQLIETEVAENGGDVPQDGVDTEYCTHIKRVRSKKDDYTPPGIAGGQGTYTELGYRLRVMTREGAC
jgi:hypothetical protein